MAVPGNARYIRYMPVSALPGRFVYSVARFFSSVLGRFIIPITLVYAGLALLFVNQHVAAGLIIAGSSLLFFVLIPLQRNAREYRWLEPAADLLRLPGSGR